MFYLQRQSQAVGWLSFITRIKYKEHLKKFFFGLRQVTMTALAIKKFTGKFQKWYLPAPFADICIEV